MVVERWRLLNYLDRLLVVVDDYRGSLYILEYMEDYLLVS